MIHNHFIVKSLHLTRPGGLVLVLTSRYTMDARNPAARREIAALADLVGALRLPGGVHQRAAGTRVVTDLLVLRRREHDRPASAGRWEQARLTSLGGVLVPVNEYFLDHPAAVLGTLGAASGAYHADELTVTPDGDTTAAFSAGLDRVAIEGLRHGLTFSPATATPTARAEPAELSRHPDGYLAALADGTFTEVADGTARPFQVPRSQTAELRALLSLRDTAVRLLDAEAGSADDTTDIERWRRELGRQYDAYLRAYGPVNRFSVRRTGRTDPATGEQVTARISPPQGGFRGDPYAPLVYALEEFDPASQHAAKAAIFTRRVIAPRTPQLGADTAADALAICLDTHGQVRLGDIARLLGTDQATARTELASLVFDEPDSGELVPAAEYLSGNVRARLRAAQRAARADSRFEANATALRQVLPADLEPGEIDARLGAAWIDRAYIEQFERPWDLHRIKPRFFSQHVSAALGRRAEANQSAIPLEALPEVWSGRFDTSAASRAEARANLTRTAGEPLAAFTHGHSPYADRFHQGATFVPQFIFLVEPDDVGPLGTGVGRRALRSRRSANEHPPWKNLASLREVIEDRFVYRLYLGESLLPFVFSTQ